MPSLPQNQIDALSAIVESFRDGVHSTFRHVSVGTLSVQERLPEEDRERFFLNVKVNIIATMYSYMLKLTLTSMPTVEEVRDIERRAMRMANEFLQPHTDIDLGDGRVLWGDGAPPERADGRRDGPPSSN